MFLLSTPKILTTSLLLPSNWLNANVHTMSFTITSLEDHCHVMWLDSPNLRLSINSLLCFILLVSHKYDGITTPIRLCPMTFSIILFCTTSSSLLGSLWWTWLLFLQHLQWIYELPSHPCSFNMNPFSKFFFFCYMSYFFFSKRLSLLEPIPLLPYIFCIWANTSRSSSSSSSPNLSFSTNPSSPKTFYFSDIFNVSNLSMCSIQQQGTYFLLFLRFPLLNQLHSKGF